MIDLHMHTLFSDGVLLPAELIQRAYHAGYRALALTDHVDMSNMDFVVPRIVKAVNELSGHAKVTVLPGVEITHVPPRLIRGLVQKARKLGAQVVIVHGETLAEPVAPGTNRAGIDAGADIISHPGLISRQDAIKARLQGTALEITSRKGHSISNGHVARTAMEAGARLVLNTDSHGPEDLISRERAQIILQAAGISRTSDIKKILKNSEKIVRTLRRS